MNTLLLFIVCTFANVIISTIKSVMTIKGGKLAAAFWNAFSFGLYSFIVILMATADISTFEKIAVTVICNLVGVYGVKLVEEKMRKDRPWKIEVAVRSAFYRKMLAELEAKNIPNNYSTLGKHTIFNCYCNTKEQSKIALEIAKHYNAKTFATETTLAP